MQARIIVATHKNEVKSQHHDTHDESSALRVASMRARAVDKLQTPEPPSRQCLTVHSP